MRPQQSHYSMPSIRVLVPVVVLAVDRLVLLMLHNRVALLFYLAEPSRKRDENPLNYF